MVMSLSDDTSSKHVISLLELSASNPQGLPQGAGYGIDQQQILLHKYICEYVFTNASIIHKYPINISKRSLTNW